MPPKAKKPPPPKPLVELAHAPLCDATLSLEDEVDTAADAEPETYESDFVDVPHRGYIAISRKADGSGQELIHGLTLERQDLPPGAWSLVWSPDGFCCVVADNRDEIFHTEDVLKKILCRGNDGLLYLCVKDAAQGDTFVDFSSTLTKFEVVSVQFQVSHLHVLAEATVFFLSHSRQRARFFWSAKSLYSLLGLTCYNKEWSAWASRSHASWLQTLATRGLSQHNVLFSEQTQLAKQVVPEEMRFLPQGAISTQALLMLASRWAGCIPRHGGLSKPSDRAAAKELLDAIVRGGCAIQDFSCPVRFSDDWETGWPAQDHTPAPLELVVLKSGRIDWTSFHSAVLGDLRRHPVSSLWYSALFGATRPATEPVSDFLVRCISGTASSLADQVCWHLARRIEMCILGAIQGRRLPPGAFKASAEDIMSLLGFPGKLNRELLKHILASREASKTETNFCRCTDKSNVGGTQLQAGLLCFGGTGEVSVMCPQAMGYFIRRLIQLSRFQRSNLGSKYEF